MKEKINKLKKGLRANKYVCKLAIFDHIRECLEKDNYLKANDIPKHSEEYKKLDKELMDLKIILDIYFDGNKELYLQRINKFLENL